MFQRSHDIWEDMRRRGILSVIDAAKPDKLAQALGRCRATPGEPRHPRNGAS
jgi:hypothetical protein